ncbi:MAG: hypothetical protein JW934_21585 [Anaerolineae bacterium]|nr:hypothetical protein [Anaerolineae bacterium]
MFPIAPPIVLAVVIASVYTGLFNLWRKGSPRDLLFYLFAAWVGFGLGQIAGILLRLDWLMIGSVYLIEGTVFSWALLFLMQWLRMPKHR